MPLDKITEDSFLTKLIVGWWKLNLQPLPDRVLRDSLRQSFPGLWTHPTSLKNHLKDFQHLLHPLRNYQRLQKESKASILHKQPQRGFNPRSKYQLETQFVHSPPPSATLKKPYHPELKLDECLQGMVQTLDQHFLGPPTRDSRATPKQSRQPTPKKQSHGPNFGSKLYIWV